MHFEELYTRFLGDEYDKPGEGGAQRKLMICTTPRTGGHACCQQLKQLGLGIPTEYMDDRYALPLMRRWLGQPELDKDGLHAQAAQYGERLLSNRSRNGVFAAKLFAENLQFTREAFGGDDDSWLYLRLYRRDKVAQTISLLSVLYTGRAFDSDEPLLDAMVLGIDPTVVRNTIMFIHGSEKMWAGTLAAVPAKRQAALAFEDLVSDPLPAVRAAVASWFPDTQLSGEPAAAQRRYSVDRELKMQIAQNYAAGIARLWRELPPTGFETISTGAP